MGRKKLGNRVYAKRVTESEAAVLEAALLGVRCLGVAQNLGKGGPVPVAVPERGQITALLDDVERLEKELVYWKDRFEKAVNAAESQMISYWKNRALKAEMGVVKGEHDQT